jgi:hypothetical protein
VDPIQALQGLVSVVVTNSQSIFTKLDNPKIVGANYKLVHVATSNGIERKCYLQVQPVDTSDRRIVDRDITEIFHDVTVPYVNMGRKKRQKVQTQLPKDVHSSRRSGRIGGETLCYKDAKRTMMNFLVTLLPGLKQ